MLVLSHRCLVQVASLLGFVIPENEEALRRSAQGTLIFLQELEQRVILEGRRTDPTGEERTQETQCASGAEESLRVKEHEHGFVQVTQIELEKGRMNECSVV